METVSVLTGKMIQNDPEFSKTLNEAYDAGVEIVVYKTENTLESIEVTGEALDFDLSI